jgi:hypothetical protein
MIKYSTSDVEILVKFVNSGMSEDMYEEGYENIVNIDISHAVVKYMEEKCKIRYNGMQCMI